jgi:branched-chain amino acid transport system substrate-binding protein
MSKGKMPTRRQVADAVRATKDFDTVIGKITFDTHGDPMYATYYILKVTSADPANWSQNELVTSVTAPSPLTKAAAATPEATESK